ncbi:MAG: carboxypeptidase-like regulatory domain-containing protein [Thermoanaerobaculales bacterium]|nr:carboxypeptidase-like regulatory domain-containing protein [Thermoanaerobaculales bacterium]
MATVIVILGCGLAYAMSVSYTVEVIDGNTENPIEDADVYLIGTVFLEKPPGFLTYEEVTDEDGEAYFPSVQTGEYSLVIMADGYGPYSEVVTIDASKRRRSIAVF